MLLTVVVAVVRTGQTGILRVVALGRIADRVTVLVMAHERVHIRVIVVQMNRHRTLVVRRIMVPVPGRVPRSVGRPQQMRVNRRSRDENRLYDVAVAVDVGRTYDLHMAGSVDSGNLSHYSGHILIDVGSQDCLDEEHMSVVLDHFEDSEIIHISVAVEVEVGQHVGTVVQQAFKLLHGGRLGESRAHSLQVEIQRNVLAGGIHARSGRDGLRSGHRDGGAVRTRVDGRRNGDDTGHAARGKEQWQKSQNKQSAFHNSWFYMVQISSENDKSPSLRH